MDTSEKQIKRIVLNRMDRCTVCHHAFAPEEIHVISRRPDMWMMVVECGECHARNFVAAVLNDGDPEEAQVALRRLSQGEPQTEPEPIGPLVGVDDVLEMHDFLREFDGDFLRLFRDQ
jgi:hypothetical protein